MSADSRDGRRADEQKLIFLFTFLNRGHIFGT
jgi:hypothetical protein